jgi:hypothetical protein
LDHLELLVKDLKAAMQVAVVITQVVVVAQAVLEPTDQIGQMGV